MLIVDNYEQYNCAEGNLPPIDEIHFTAKVKFSSNPELGNQVEILGFLNPLEVFDADNPEREKLGGYFTQTVSKLSPSLGASFVFIAANDSLYPKIIDSNGKTTKIYGYLLPYGDDFCRFEFFFKTWIEPMNMNDIQLTEWFTNLQNHIKERNKLVSEANQKKLQDEVFMTNFKYLCSLGMNSDDAKKQAEEIVAKIKNNLSSGEEKPAINKKSAK
jgi:hypothetical protein